MDHLASSPSAFFSSSLFFSFLVVSPYLSGTKGLTIRPCVSIQTISPNQQSTHSTRLRPTTATKKLETIGRSLLSPFLIQLGHSYSGNQPEEPFSSCTTFPAEQVDSTGRNFLPSVRAYPSNCLVYFDIFLSRGSSFGRFCGSALLRNRRKTSLSSYNLKPGSSVGPQKASLCRLYLS